MSTLQQWEDAYTAHFGKKLLPEEVAAWEDELTNAETGIHNIRAGEALAAVRAIAERIRVGELARKFAPTVDDLKSAIIRQRGKERAARDGTAEKMQQPIAAKRNAIRAAKSLNAIWTILANAGTAEELRDLVAFSGEVYGARMCKPVMPAWEDCRALADRDGIDILAAHSQLWNEYNAAAEARFNERVTRP